MSDEKCILLVEDNPDDEDLTLRALRKNHVLNHVTVARDGAEALALLHGDPETGREPIPVPQLVLLDINLPKVTGIEVLKKIRAHPRTATMPVVVLTSSSEDRDLSECYRNGVNSYIRKPVDFTQFTDSVKTLGLYWLVLNELPKPPA